ncbi:hypothetical protein BASA81_018381 [Batrachochytrium salamandrivorans]|nr:hypothetical protein BASA81_018381 [Batrachochytrium salamandrivorans]
MALPVTDGSTEILARFKRQPTPAPSKIFTESVYEWIPLDEETPTPASDEDPADIGLSYILQQLNIQPDEFTRRTNFTDLLGVTHLYGMPLYKGLFIEDLHAAVHIKDSQVVFYSATTILDDHVLTKRSPPIPESTIKISSEDAVTSPTIPESIVEMSSEDAVKAAVDCLKVPFYDGIAPVMESYETDKGDIPVWVVQLRDNPTTQWIEVKVNAITGDIVSKEDVKRDSTYTAIELPKESPNDGFSTIVSPENFQASPNGWTDGYKLAGNNVLAIVEGDMTFKTTTRGLFKGDFDPTLPPQTPKNFVAGAVNAFYVANMVHDVFYLYGFNEPAGNFQRDNFGRGGIEDDPVIISLQNSERENYANFHAPFDGHPGVLNLHIFTATEPNRDPALDNNAIIHELTHGLSSRLTGGAQTKMCISKIESRGLGEGYSDVMALIFMAKPEDTRNTEKVIGEYIRGSSQGIRRYPYTTDMKVNPLKYQNAVGEKDKYRLGEIWASLLWEVYWNLVDTHGFSANLHDAKQKEGNIIFLQLLVGTMMIQPCNPTFESAHHAMIVADAVYYGGIHEHLINKGFAKRGLGSIS